MTARVLHVALLLFGSGACALIYQVVWLRELRLVFGASTAASAAVLAIFMGGLGLGGIFLGRRADRHARPLLLYAHLELSIAGCTMISPFLIIAMRQVYIWLGGSLVMGISTATLVRVVMSVLVLGLPTFLMGGTLPAAARAVAIEADTGRKRVAVLYGINTLGAVMGVAVATFFMLEIFGTRNTLWIASLLNGLIGMLARRLSLSRPSKEIPEEEEIKASISDSLPLKSYTPAGFVYAAAGIVGFAFMLMELVWYRMLGPLLGGTTYTFGLILAMALFGIGLGGAAYALRSQSSHATLRTFAFTCGLEALCISFPYALGDRVAVFAALLRPLGQIGLVGHVIGWSMVTGLVILPAAVISGYQFPLLIGLLGKGDRQVGQHIGLTYAWNTGGAIIGSLAGGFLLLPFLTAPGSWKGAVFLLAMLGVAAVLFSLKIERRNRFITLPVAVIICSLLLFLAVGPTAAWRHSPIGAGRVNLTGHDRNGIKNWLHNLRRVTVWQAEGREVSLALSARDGLAFVINGKTDGNAKHDAPTQVMLGMVSAILHPDPQSAMVIGLGTGSSAGWLAAIESIKRVDVVELEPNVLEIARQCAPVNHNVLTNPKVRTIISDAREVLLTFPDQYDLIVSEPSNPYRAGIASLYTREFYQAVAQRLAPGGMFSQWIQAYEVDTLTVQTIYATLLTVFPHIETWQTMGKDMLLVCSLAPRKYSVPQLRRRLSLEPFGTATRVSWGALNLEGFLSRFVAAPPLARKLAGRENQSRNLNTDDRLLVEFGFARTVGRQKSFSINDLAYEARKRNMNRLPVFGGAVDWEMVDENRIKMFVLERNVVPHLSWLNKEQRIRADALNNFLNGKFEAVLESWNRQQRNPEHPLELAMVAEALADAGDQRVVNLVEKLRPLWPAETDAILARFYWKTKRPEEALQAYRAAFLRLRSDPWPYAIIMQRALYLATKIAGETPGMTSRFYELLSVPFSVKILNEERLNVLLNLSTGLKSEDVVKLIKHYETGIPWNRSFLNKRLTVYKAVADSMVLQAENDLDEYFKNAPVGISDVIQ